MLGLACATPQDAGAGRTVVVIHVDDGDVGRPSCERRVGLIDVADRPDHEQPVIEGELDQVGDERSILQTSARRASSAAVGA